jgi:hypothetical protein
MLTFGRGKMYKEYSFNDFEYVNLITSIIVVVMPRA